MSGSVVGKEPSKVGCDMVYLVVDHIHELGMAPAESSKEGRARGFLADVSSAHTIQLVLHRLPAACGGQFMAIRDEVAF